MVVEEKDESTQPLLNEQEQRQHLTLPVRSPDSDDDEEEEDFDEDLDDEDDEDGSASLLRQWLARWCLARLPTIHRHLRTLQQVLAVPLMEAVGTGLLTLVVAMLSRPDAHTPALTSGLAIGATLAAMVYGGARISGAHFNPAVTFMLLLLRKVTPFQALVYLGSQVGGAVGGARLAGALVAPDVLGDPSVTTVRGCGCGRGCVFVWFGFEGSGGLGESACVCAPPQQHHVTKRPTPPKHHHHNKQVTGRLSLVEMAFTFALCFTVAHTVLPPAQQPNR
jgi:glycerol uptake facilitator-like aquaporin